MKRSFGRLYVPDARDGKFMIPRKASTHTTRYWNQNGWWGDQKATSQCFPPGTPVLMADGTERAIEDVHAGDLVISHTGQVRMVEAVMAREFHGNLTSVRVRSLRSPLLSTDGHPYLVTHFKPTHPTNTLQPSGTKWVEAAKLKPKERGKSGDYVHLHTAICCEKKVAVLDVLELVPDARVFDSGRKVRAAGCGKKYEMDRYIPVSRDLAWLLGLYLAEGSTRGGKSDATLALGGHEMELAERAAKIIEKDLRVEAFIQRRPNNVIVVHARGCTVAKLLHELCGRGSDGKRLHSLMWSWHDELLSGLWDGWHDGDGWVEGDGKRTVAVTVSEQLARDMWRVGMHLGYAPTLRFSDPTHPKMKKKRRWDVAVYGDTSHTWRPRGDGCIYLAVEKVDRESYCGLVYNLQVAVDESYVANMVIVHNCVGYGWAHWLEDGPVTHGGKAPILKPALIYKEAQQCDEWPGESYEGTSVRAGAKVLKAHGLISEYRWAFDVGLLIETVLELGPVVVGTNWYTAMCDTDEDGYIHASGRVCGGHAYVINGVNTRDEKFRIKNSWGRNWGRQGTAWITFEDMDLLIEEEGEACLALEVRDA